MLGKLIKYDNRAVGRILLPLYGGLIVLALLNNLLRAISGLSDSDALLLQFAFMLETMIYVLVICVSIFATVFILVSRFYTNMTKDEGYLTHTLPVDSGTLIGAKLLSGLLWMLLGILAGLISGLCLFQPSELTDFIDNAWPYLHQFSLVMKEAEIAWVPYVVEVGILIFIALPESLLSFYLAIAIGNQSNNHRVLSSIGAYIGVVIVKQMVYTAVSYATTFFAEESDSVKETMGSVVRYMHITFITSIVLEIAFCVAAFFLTRWLFQRKLNLA